MSQSPLEKMSFGLVIEEQLALFPGKLSVRILELILTFDLMQGSLLRD